jgi:hypothetical protein
VDEKWHLFYNLANVQIQLNITLDSVNNSINTFSVKPFLESNNNIQLNLFLPDFIADLKYLLNINYNIL